MRWIHCFQNSYSNWFSFDHFHSLPLQKTRMLGGAQSELSLQNACHHMMDRYQTSVILLKAVIHIWLKLFDQIFIPFFLFQNCVLNLTLICCFLVIVLIIIRFFNFLRFFKYYSLMQIKSINFTSFFFAFGLHSETNLQKNKSFYEFII